MAIMMIATSRRMAEEHIVLHAFFWRFGLDSEPKHRCGYLDVSDAKVRGRTFTKIPPPQKRKNDEVEIPQESLRLF